MLFSRDSNFSGVLNHFWIHQRSVYYSFINVSSSGYTSNNYPQNVIDFSSTSWWCHKADNTYIQFCLPQHKLRLTGYDIQTSSASCKMNNWTITGCTNYFSCPSTSTNSKQTYKDLTSLETATIDWSPTESYQCFRLTHFGSACSQQAINAFDVKQIDFYGYLYSLINKNINSNAFININCVSNYLFIFIFK